MSKNERIRKSQSPIQKSYYITKENKHNLAKSVKPVQLDKILKESNCNIAKSTSKSSNLKYRENTKNNLKTEYQ